MRKPLLLIPALILGAGVAGIRFAHAAPPPRPPQAIAAHAATVTDTDQLDVQSGDQSGVDAPETTDAATGGAATTAAPSTPDTDTVQSGDQSGPDTGGSDATDSGP